MVTRVTISTKTQSNLSTTATSGRSLVAVMGRWPLWGGTSKCMDCRPGRKAVGVVERWPL